MSSPSAASWPRGILEAEMSKQPIVLFDGVCNFCNASANFIIRHDRRAVFRFAPLQSPAGERLLREHGADIGGLDTLVLIEGRQSCRKSAAALRIAPRLSGPHPPLYRLIVLPPPPPPGLHHFF